MSSALLLQTTRRRDAADDAALAVVARELFPANVVAATADPDRTAQVLDVPVVAATPASLLRMMTAVDTLVLLGSQPLQAETGTEVLGLSGVYSVATAYRLAGKRVALVGVGVGEVSGRSGRLVRQTVLGSSLTVLDSETSARHVASVGVPAPFRVGPDLAWLDLQDPPAAEAPGGPVRVPVGVDDVAAAGGAPAVAALLTPVLEAVLGQVRTASGVVVQARRRGAAAGDDLDAADAVATLLGRAGLDVAVEPTARTLRAQRDDVGRSSFALCAHPHAMMTAAAAGVPVLAWPQDDCGRAVARDLEIPSVTGAADVPGGVDLVVEAAARRSGSVHSAARRQIAAAGDVLDLLALLVSEGDSTLRPLGQGADELPHRPTGLRPRG